MVDIESGVIQRQCPKRVELEIPRLENLSLGTYQHHLTLLPRRQRECSFTLDLDAQAGFLPTVSETVFG